MDDSLFSATLFNITYTPDDNTLRIKINGISSLSGNVTAKISLIAYGYEALAKDLNPCEMTGFEGMCPMSSGLITLNSHIEVGSSVANAIPSM
jgi:predicted HicB family RNase H-like nuclease